MKRFLLVVLGVVVLMMALSPVLVAKDENFDRAGQRALAEWEEILLEKQEEVQTLISRVAAERVATRADMFQLKVLVDNFQAFKKEADAHLQLYGLETATALDVGLKEAISNYFGSPPVLFKGDHGDQMRGYLARVTGQDIVVEGGAIWDRSSILLLVGAIIAFVIFAFFVLYVAELWPFAILVGIALMVMLLLLLV